MNRVFRNRWLLAEVASAAAVVVVLVLIVRVVVSHVATWAVVGEVELTGYRTLEPPAWPIVVHPDRVDSVNPGGDLCEGGDGFEDLDEGTEVMVHSNEGIAEGELRVGETDGPSAGSCIWTFRVDGVPKGADPYYVQVGDRVPVLVETEPGIDGRMWVRIDYEGGNPTPPPDEGAW